MPFFLLNMVYLGKKMTIPTRYKILIFIVYTAVVAASAYYFAPQKIQIVEKEVKVEVAKKDTDVDQHGHVDTTTKIKTNKDGTTITVIHKIQDDNVDTKTKVDTTITDNKDKSTTIEKSKGFTNLSFLAGISTTQPGNPMLYGASVNRSILGPISIGLWGLSDGSCGASIGLNF